MGRLPIEMNHELDLVSRRLAPARCGGGVEVRGVGSPVLTHRPLVLCAVLRRRVVGGSVWCWGAACGHCRHWRRRGRRGGRGQTPPRGLRSRSSAAVAADAAAAAVDASCRADLCNADLYRRDGNLEEHSVLRVAALRVRRREGDRGAARATDVHKSSQQTRHLGSCNSPVSGTQPRAMSKARWPSEDVVLLAPGHQHNSRGAGR
mmetsp:Transcript_65558/g.188618  ORF Transcript_65558/g.188618 Transcript_65558/m.188618 type:complete len:205 (+) Transcript_65558:45-659(+)